MKEQEQELLNITLAPGQENATITILHGVTATPLPLKDNFQKFTSGVATIDGPHLFAEHLSKHKLLKTDRALASVHRDDMKIVLSADPTDKEAPTVTGQLQLSQDFRAIGINSEARYSLDTLRDFVRMNRSLFPDKEKHAKLLVAISDFKAKVNIEIEQRKDQRGNSKSLVEKTIESGGIPFSFDVEVQVFKGGAKQRFNIEICLASTDGSVRFWFESPEAAELIREQRDFLINSEIKFLTDLDITVLEF